MGFSIRDSRALHNRTARNCTLSARVLLASVIVSCAVTSTGSAQGAYAGAWHVTAWKVAPWIASAEQSSIKADKLVLDHDIVFSGSKITGPKIIACAGPKYEIKSVPFENLFEGGLKKPATEAPALGFKSPVRTLMPGCDMEFHSLNETSAMFALDNVLYTMKKRAVVKPAR